MFISLCSGLEKWTILTFPAIALHASKSNIPDVKILILTSSFVQCILVRVGHYIIIHIHSSFNKTRGMSKVLIFNKNMMNHVAYLTTCNL